MSASTPSPARWAGPALIAIGVLHTVVMLIAFHGPYWQIASAGLFNTIDESTDPSLGLAFWTLQFGFLLIVIGALIPSQRKPVSRLAALVLLVAILLGILIMPLSGFWLGLPVAIALCMRG